MSSRVPVAAAWETRAACRGVDPGLFFPERGQSTEPAKAICQTCPVILECHQAALAGPGGPELFGVWAGLSELERRALRRRRRAAA